MRTNFNYEKMMPGEWAVSTDEKTSTQTVWMCFAPGVVKRMGTYDDFILQIKEISTDLVEEIQTTVEKNIFEKFNFDPEIIKQLEQAAEQAQQAAQQATTAVEEVQKITEKLSIATDETDGLFSAQDKKKLDGIQENAQVNTITGVKGEKEEEYQTGNVIISAENVGAVTTEEFEEYKQTIKIPQISIDIEADGESDEKTVSPKAVIEYFSTHGGGGSGGGTSSGVTGVKGAKEERYRTGQVSLDATNIGAVSTEDFEEYKSTNKIPEISTDIKTDFETDEKVASSKAVYTYVAEVVGNIEDLLETI